MYRNGSAILIAMGHLPQASFITIVKGSCLSSERLLWIGYSPETTDLWQRAIEKEMDGVAVDVIPGVSCVHEKAEKPQRFFPSVSELIPASPPYPPDTFYKVSVGLEASEVWDPNYVPVVKIEIVIGGQVQEDLAPSFPVNADDYQRVCQTVEKLLGRA
jgi:hypothetical protein